MTYTSAIAMAKTRDFFMGDSSWSLFLSRQCTDPSTLRSFLVASFAGGSFPAADRDKAGAMGIPFPGVYMSYFYHISV